MEKEYNGERVVAKYDAKIVPSNSNHLDFVSTLMLTDQYLYVLEDNTDGSYAEYFKFGIKEIDTIEIERPDSKARAEQMTKSAIAKIIEHIALFFSGWICLPSISMERQGKWNSGYLVLKYHTKQGQNERIYFCIGSQGADNFVDCFQKLRESYLLY